MKYYVEQRLFSFFDKFDIYDENGDVAYYVEGSFLSFGKQFRIYDKHNNQVGYIEQKILTFLPQFEIYVDNIHIGTKKQNLLAEVTQGSGSAFQFLELTSMLLFSEKAIYIVNCANSVRSVMVSANLVGVFLG